MKGIAPKAIHEDIKIILLMTVLKFQLLKIGLLCLSHHQDAPKMQHTTDRQVDSVKSMVMNDGHHSVDD